MRTIVTFRRTGGFVVVMMVSLFALSVSPASAQDSAAAVENNRKWNYTELTKVPEMARAKRNPFENESDSVLAGGKLFQRHCAECHGIKAEGGKRGPSLLREEVQQAAPGTLFWILTNGVVWQGMPVWSKLPEPQRWQIVAFLKSFRTPPSSQRPDDSE